MNEPGYHTADDIRKLREDIDLIKKALLGDLSANKDARGLIANHLTMMDDLYKNGSGIKLRVEKLETYKIQMAAWIGGASFICAGIWLVLKEVLVKK